MDLKEEATKDIEAVEISDIIKKFEDSNHKKLEKSLKDFIGYFKQIYKELGLEWKEEDTLKTSAIFDAVLERAKIEAIQIMLSTAHCDTPKKSEQKQE